ncbi:MAG: hypothetical protein R3C16_10570 [Hyphomonadaceae bacterium]
MRAAPVRFVMAALWPLAIWTSLTHLKDHPADDYVERTSPIVATAIAFWACLGIIAAFYIAYSGGFAVMGFDGEEGVRYVRRLPGIVPVFWFFLPVIYVVGFWLYTTRDEAYPR